MKPSITFLILILFTTGALFTGCAKAHDKDQNAAMTLPGSARAGAPAGVSCYFTDNGRLDKFACIEMLGNSSNESAFITQACGQGGGNAQLVQHRCPSVNVAATCTLTKVQNTLKMRLYGATRAEAQQVCSQAGGQITAQ